MVFALVPVLLSDVGVASFIFDEPSGLVILVLLVLLVLGHHLSMFLCPAGLAPVGGSLFGVVLSLAFILLCLECVVFVNFVLKSVQGVLPGLYLVGPGLQSSVLADLRVASL